MLLWLLVLGVLWDLWRRNGRVTKLLLLLLLVSVVLLLVLRLVRLIVATLWCSMLSRLDVVHRWAVMTSILRDRHGSIARSSWRKVGSKRVGCVAWSRSWWDVAAVSLIVWRVAHGHVTLVVETTSAHDGARPPHRVHAALRRRWRCWLWRR